MKVVKATAAGLGQCFKGSKYNKARYMDLLALMYDILQKARKEGLMSIERTSRTRTPPPSSRSTRRWAMTTTSPSSSPTTCA